MNKILFLLILVSPKYAKAQIEEFVSYTDSTTTNKYSCITTFNSNDKGFTLAENKIYKANNLIEYKTIIGTISSINTDSIFYGKNKNQKIWIKFQTIAGDKFDYVYSLKDKNKFLKYKKDYIKNCLIELPASKAKTFLNSVW